MELTSISDADIVAELASLCVPSDRFDPDEQEFPYEELVKLAQVYPETLPRIFMAMRRLHRVMPLGKDDAVFKTLLGSSPDEHSEDRDEMATARQQALDIDTGLARCLRDLMIKKDSQHDTHPTLSAEMSISPNDKIVPPSFVRLPIQREGTSSTTYHEMAPTFGTLGTLPFDKEVKLNIQFKIPKEPCDTNYYVVVRGNEASYTAENKWIRSHVCSRTESFEVTNACIPGTNPTSSVGIPLAVSMDPTSDARVGTASVVLRVKRGAQAAGWRTRAHRIWYIRIIVFQSVAQPQQDLPTALIARVATIAG